MELKYLVIHCTATPEGREVSADEIRRWEQPKTVLGFFQSRMNDE